MSEDNNEQFCPWCEDSTRQVMVQYEPDPNDAQREADDIPTDELQLVAGSLCCECGDLITAHPEEATRSIGPDANA